MCRSATVCLCFSLGVFSIQNVCRCVSVNAASARRSLVITLKVNGAQNERLQLIVRDCDNRSA